MGKCSPEHLLLSDSACALWWEQYSGRHVVEDEMRGRREGAVKNCIMAGKEEASA